jgi:uncharacterized protein (TIGR00255 family)
VIAQLDLNANVCYLSSKIKGLAMIRSMTGFARHELAHPQGVLSWEMRAVNHRFLEFQFRLPDAMRALEMRFREVIRQQVERGRIDATLKLQWSIAKTGALQCDEVRLNALLAAVERIETLSPFSHSAPSLDCLLMYPGIISEIEIDVTQIETIAVTALEQALGLLNDSRQREGDALRLAIIDRLHKVEALAKEVSLHQPELLKRQQNKLLERLQHSPVQGDAQRLEQELVFWAQKIDNSEEVDRLLTHVAEVRRLLQQKGSVGKTLDFMMQELNREANTMASKSLDSQVSKATVDLKVLIEQMREQVQNIE